MIEISNLRIVEDDYYSKLIVDISSDVKRSDNETSIWVMVEKEHRMLLQDKAYNAFLLLPLYMSMYYHTDLRIHGNVSKVLYKKLPYIQAIIASFSDRLTRQNVLVDGYTIDNSTGGGIGTGVSCGVDCLQTIFTNFIEEEDPEYRINTLFEFNCGWHGKYSTANTNFLFKERCNTNRYVAQELGLNFVSVDSNLHAFLWELGDQVSYFYIYSCIFALEKGLSKYYVSSSFSYGQIMDFGSKAREKDFSEYGDAMLIPLLRSETLEIISDGCQYKRSEKIELISNWSISKKYLNVCCKNNGIENCSVCNKCVRTLLPLEAMGMLEDYKSVFNINAYKKIAFKGKCSLAIRNKRYGFESDNYEFLRKKGIRLPPKIIGRFRFLPDYFMIIIKKIFNK